MKQILLISFLILLCSCNRGPKTVKYFDEETGEYVIDTLPYNDIRDYPQIRYAENQDSLIEGLIKADIVEERHIGIAGMYSKQFARYERLTELTNEKELLELTKHQSPIIRIYAFKGLLEKDSKLAEKAKNHLEIDSTEFRHAAGCIIGGYKVSEYVKYLE